MESPICPFCLGILVPILREVGGPWDTLCPRCLGGEKPNNADGAQQAIALYAFMGWLTTRDKKAGPFSATDTADEAAQLVGEFCKKQGWEIPSDVQTEKALWKEIKPMP